MISHSSLKNVGTRGIVSFYEKLLIKGSIMVGGSAFKRMNELKLRTVATPNDKIPKSKIK